MLDLFELVGPDLESCADSIADALAGPDAFHEAIGIARVCRFDAAIALITNADSGGMRELAELVIARDCVACLYLAASQDLRFFRKVRAQATKHYPTSSYLAS